ncbi:MAG: hypothetical protein OXF02_04390 [Simkaniaceae bacterium]|nr:hypothetical protein [Simkaniaceae bacterium]
MSMYGIHIANGVIGKVEDRLRICFACQANVKGEAIYCPFCGENLPAPCDIPLEGSGSFSGDEEESLASLYSPPYSIRGRSDFGIPDKEPPTMKCPGKDVREEEEVLSGRVVPEREDHPFRVRGEVQEEEEDTEKGCGGLFPLVSLFLGTHLVLFGLLTLLFAKGGILSLQWDAHYWFLYCIIGVPAVYFGVRSLRAL